MSGHENLTLHNERVTKSIIRGYDRDNKAPPLLQQSTRWSHPRAATRISPTHHLGRRTNHLRAVRARRNGIQLRDRHAGKCVNGMFCQDAAFGVVPTISLTEQLRCRQKTFALSALLLLFLGSFLFMARSSTRYTLLKGRGETSFIATRRSGRGTDYRSLFPTKASKHQVQVSQSLSQNAVCVVGKLGHALALASLQKHVLQDMRADLFIVSPDSHRVALEGDPPVFRTSNSHANLTDFFDKLNPDWKKAPSGNYLGGLPGFPSTGAFQLRDKFTCDEVISRHELKRGFNYSYVGVGRMDLLWLQKHPTLQPHGCWIPCKTNDWGGVCDHWAWCNRSSASLLMKSPVFMLPNEPSNTELHLKLTLEKSQVYVARGEVAFVRSCITSSTLCKEVLQSGIFAKPSGGQIDSALNLWLSTELTRKRPVDVFSGNGLST